MIVLIAAWFQILPSKILEIYLMFNQNIDVTFNIFVLGNFHSFDLNFFLFMFKLLRLKWQDNKELIFAFMSGRMRNLSQDWEVSPFLFKTDKRKALRQKKENIEKERER